MTGLQMTERLRGAGVSSVLLPIVLMSTHNSKELAEGAYEAGANDWMNKPVSTREVASRVREQARTAHSRRAFSAPAPFVRTCCKGRLQLRLRKSLVHVR